MIVALEKERRQMETLLCGTRGVVKKNEVLVSESGIGKVNAALITAELIRKEMPDVIINTGVAGGIDADLHAMDVVAGYETCYHDVWCGDGNEKGQIQGLPARFSGDAHLLSVAHNIGLCCGLICTGDQFITNRELLNKIKADFPEGLAVDMESAAIAQTCYLLHVPFLSLRIISDTPGNTEDHTKQYNDFWKQMGDTSFRIIKTFLEAL